MTVAVPGCDTMETAMINCPRCEGFVPPTQSACPNCDTSLSRRVLRHATKLAVGAATAMTLMACYGGGPMGPEPTSNCDSGFVDNDRDGYCNNVDCDDDDGSRTTNCPDTNPGCTDADGDGWCSDEDCNDNNASIGPDCECVDLDGDGFCNTEDCDDQDPGRWESCDDFCDVAETIDDPGDPKLGSTAEGYNLASTCGDGDAERTYDFTVEGDPGTLQWVTAVVTSETKHYLSVREDCRNAQDIACGFEEPRAEWLAEPGKQYWLIVEAASFEDRGEFGVTINTQPLVCGDGEIVGPEECDDGNTEDGDGCSATCRDEGGNP
jgi:cysteine-rich repeat protein